MAEALTKRRFGNSVQVKSAGLRPQPPQEAANAIEILRTEFDLDASGHIPRDVRDFNFEDFDYVVAMDKDIARQLKEISNFKLLVWKIDDPYGNDLLEYRQCALKIMQEVSRLPIESGSFPAKNDA